MSQWSFVALARRTGHAIVAPPWRMLAPAALAVVATPAAGAGLVVEDWIARACAITVASNETVCSGNSGVDVIDTGPHASGPLAYQPSTAYLSKGQTAAYQTAGGWNAANAASSSPSHGQNFSAVSEAFLQVTGRNTGESPESYTFHFLINGGALTMALQEFIASGSRYPTAQIKSEVWFGRDEDTPLGTWSYTATLTGVNSEIPVIFAEHVFDPYDYAIGKPQVTVTHGLTPEGVRSASVSFGPFVGAIPVPLTAPDESIMVRYGVFARAYTGQHDPAPNPLYDEPFTDVSAWIADPFGLEDDPVPGSYPADGFDLDGQSIASLTAVPAPPAAGLFPVMLVAVARFAVRARRKAA